MNGLISDTITIEIALSGENDLFQPLALIAGLLQHSIADKGIQTEHGPIGCQEGGHSAAI